MAGDESCPQGLGAAPSPAHQRHQGCPGGSVCSSTTCPAPGLMELVVQGLETSLPRHAWEDECLWKGGGRSPHPEPPRLSSLPWMQRVFWVDGMSW